MKELRTVVFTQCYAKFASSSFFYVLQGFSTVRQILRKCTVCRRFNERPVKLNQNQYRSFRSEPGSQIFASIMLDYAGP